MNKFLDTAISAIVIVFVGWLAYGNYILMNEHYSNQKMASLAQQVQQVVQTLDQRITVLEANKVKEEK